MYYQGIDEELGCNMAEQRPRLAFPNSDATEPVHQCIVRFVCPKVEDQNCVWQFRCSQQNMLRGEAKESEDRPKISPEKRLTICEPFSRLSRTHSDQGEYLSLITAQQQPQSSAGTRVTRYWQMQDLPKARAGSGYLRF